MGGPFPEESGLYSIHIKSRKRRAVKGYLDLSGHAREELSELGYLKLENVSEL